MGDAETRHFSGAALRDVLETCVFFGVKMKVFECSWPQRLMQKSRSDPPGDRRFRPEIPYHFFLVLLRGG